MTTFRPRGIVEYGKLIWHRKLLFLLVFSVVLLATFLTLRRIRDQYQSKASIVIAGSQDDRAATAARVATITEKLYSRAFLEPIILSHNLYTNDLERGGMEAAVRHADKDIKVDAKYRGDYPESLVVAYRNANPETAQAVAADLVAAFGNMNQAIEGRLEGDSKQVSNEIAELETRLNQLGQSRAIAMARSRAAGISRGAADVARARREAAASSTETLSDRHYALEQQIAETKRQIAEQEKLVKVTPRDLKSASSYGVLLARKAELEAQLKDYESQYTDKNPKVIQTKTQITELNRQLAALGAGDQTGAAADSAEARELRALQRDLANKQTELGIVERELQRKQQTLAGTPATPTQAAAATAIGASAPIGDIGTETDAGRLGNRYTYLLHRQDELRTASALNAGLDPGIFQIVDRPVVPSAPSGPDRLKLQMIGALIALLAALLVVSLVEAPRLLQVHNERDVEYYLGAPVIGLIPESLTPVERGRKRTLALARNGSMLLLAVVLVPGLVLLLNQVGIFQLLASRW